MNPRLKAKLVTPALLNLRKICRPGTIPTLLEPPTPRDWSAWDVVIVMVPSRFSVPVDVVEYTETVPDAAVACCEKNRFVAVKRVFVSR